MKSIYVREKQCKNCTSYASWSYMWEAKFFTRLSNLGPRRYIQKIVDALNDRFLNLHIFNVAKLFSPMHYLINEIEMTSVSNLWFKKFLDIFVTIENEFDLYQVEMLEFFERMKHACAHKNINKMWAQYNSTLEWWTNWLVLEQDMANFLIILASIVLCEWGFSKQNTLKSALQLHLQLNNLDALMCIFLLESMLLIWIGQML